MTTLYDFDAQNAEELSFRRGEKLDIIEKPIHDPEWWRARNAAGQIGLVPTNYIKPTDGGPTTTSSNGLTGPYANKDWYYGLISRHQSEQLLNQRGREGDFLIRDSETNVSRFQITFYSKIVNFRSEIIP